MVSVAETVVIYNEVIVPSHVLYLLILVFVFDDIEDLSSLLDLRINKSNNYYLVLISSLITTFSCSSELGQGSRDISLSSLLNFTSTLSDVISVTRNRVIAHLNNIKLK
jgi:hypothetical protein